MSMKDLYCDGIGAAPARQYDSFDVLAKQLANAIQRFSSFGVVVRYDTKASYNIYMETLGYWVILTNSILNARSSGDTKDWSDRTSKMLTRVQQTWDSPPNVAPYRGAILNAIKNKGVTVTFPDSNFVPTMLDKLEGMNKDLVDWRKLLKNANKYMSESTVYKVLEVANDVNPFSKKNVASGGKAAISAVVAVAEGAGKAVGKGLGGAAGGVFGAVPWKPVAVIAGAYAGYRLLSQYIENRSKRGR